MAAAGDGDGAPRLPHGRGTGRVQHAQCIRDTIVTETMYEEPCLEQGVEVF